MTKTKEKISGGMLHPQGEKELELCAAFDEALEGGIPFEGLANSGPAVTDSHEEEAVAKFRSHVQSELATFINQL